MTGRLQLEVIDSVRGVPAVRMLVDLFRLDHGIGERHHLRTVETNDEGGTETALLDGDAFVPATYELLCHVGRYFEAQQVATRDGLFVEVVPIRFSIGDVSRSYRVSLLTGPCSYTVASSRS
jgi:5-hydroxyisourate hydrolase